MVFSPLSQPSELKKYRLIVQQKALFCQLILSDIIIFLITRKDNVWRKFLHFFPHETNMTHICLLCIFWMLRTIFSRWYFFQAVFSLKPILLWIPRSIRRGALCWNVLFRWCFSPIFTFGSVWAAPNIRKSQKSF